VNTATTSDQSDPAVAADGSGNLVIAFTDADGSAKGIVAQRHAGDGTPLGGDANGDGVTNVQDVFYLINHLFAAGPGPACAWRREAGVVRK